jgi:hypothetical protein
MTKEAHDIVEELRIFSTTAKGGGVYEATQAISFVAFRTSRLQVLLAEEQAKSADRLEQQTATLISLTRWLFRLTWILVVLTAGLLVFTYFLVKHG